MPLKHVSNIQESQPSERIQSNLISWFDYAFVIAGGYINVNRGDAGAYTSDFSVLNNIPDDRFAPSGVWQGIENWVYNTGGISVGVANYPPEIEVNAVLNSGSLVDYNNGRVIAADGTSSVRASYAYKWVKFASVDYTPWVMRFSHYGDRHDLYKPDDRNTAETNIPLPVVTFEVPPTTNSNFYGLGKHQSKKILRHDIIANVFAERYSDVQKIVDIIAKQEGFSFTMYNPDDVKTADETPLDFNGAINSGKNHAELARDYPWEDQSGYPVDLYLENITSKVRPPISQNLYHAAVTIKTQIVTCG